jgi:predicted NAD-dependent protein-ADP-ribosyltransferase YbiA (DUF1768 family)
VKEILASYFLDAADQLKTVANPDWGSRFHVRKCFGSHSGDSHFLPSISAATMPATASALGEEISENELRWEGADEHTKRKLSACHDQYTLQKCIVRRVFLIR